MARHRNNVQNSVCGFEEVEMNGKVSIIMPNYNCERFLEETINSVLAQTYKNWELLIVDDCSIDNSVKIIKNYCEKDVRIKLFTNEKNSGAAASRNLALREATGKWIAFLDSDDLWLPEKLEKQLNFMVDNDCKFSYTAYEHVNENKTPLNILVMGPKELSKRKMFRYCYPGCLTVMYDCSDIGVVQVPDEIANGENDYAIWLKVVKFYKCYFLNEVLALYRVRNSSLSHKSKKTKLMRNHYKLFRISEKRSAIVALFCLLRNLWFGFWKKIKYVRKIKSSNYFWS